MKDKAIDAKKGDGRTVLFTVLVIMLLFYLPLCCEDLPLEERTRVVKKMVFTGEYKIPLEERLEFINKYVESTKHDNYKHPKEHAIDAEKILQRQCGIFEKRDVIIVDEKARFVLLRPIKLLMDGISIMSLE